MTRPNRKYTLFPYTTLFRSWFPQTPEDSRTWPVGAPRSRQRAFQAAAPCARPRPLPHCQFARWRRSEEHTSELQSRENLVCRLLLEKKKSKEKIHRLNY